MTRIRSYYSTAHKYKPTQKEFYEFINLITSIFPMIENGRDKPFNEFKGELYTKIRQHIHSSNKEYSNSLSFLYAPNARAFWANIPTEYKKLLPQIWEEIMNDFRKQERKEEETNSINSMVISLSGMKHILGDFADCETYSNQLIKQLADIDNILNGKGEEETGFKTLCAR